MNELIREIKRLLKIVKGDPPIHPDEYLKKVRGLITDVEIDISDYEKLYEAEG